MITKHDIATKSPAELLAILVRDLKEGSVNQLMLLKSLTKIGLLSQEQIKVEEIIQDLTLYCEENPESNSVTMLLSGFMSQHGIGCLVNFNRAIALYEQAIKLGNATAMAHRAFMHQDGQGGPADIVKAVRLYRRAAHENEPFALNILLK